MTWKLSLLVVGCCALVQLCNGDLINQHFYKLQNSGDKTYLQAKSPAIPCKQAGIVGTVASLGNLPISYRWQYSSWPGTVYLELDSDTENGNWILNEVTMNSGGPFCYFAIRALTLTQVKPGQDVYQVEQNGWDNCLTGHGNGERISWSACDPSNPAQHWEFQQA